MFTHKSTRFRYWATVLLLLHLLAISIPASAASSAIQEKNCDDTTTQSNAFAASVAPDQQVVIPKDVVDFAVFQANWRTRYKDSDALQQLLFAELMANMNEVKDGEKLYNILNDWKPSRR